MKKNVPRMKKNLQGNQNLVMNKLSRKRKFILSFSGVFFLFCFGIFSFLVTNRDDVLIVPIDFSVFPDKPLTEVTVGSKKLSLLIDLGSCETFGLHSAIMGSILDKEFIGSGSLMTPTGDSYQIQKFIIPSICIQSYTYKKVPVYEENSELVARGGFLCGLAKRVGPIRGSIGREFLAEWTCFFDCPNERLLLAPTLDSFIKYIHLEKITPIPFDLHPQGIILSLSTDLGIKRFILDTGATVSVMRSSVVPKELAEETNISLDRYTTSSLSYNNQEFGPWPFLLYEICPEFVPDGVLGIDFFCTHLVLIDFEHSMVYLSRYDPSLLSGWNLFLKTYVLRLFPNNKCLR